MRIEIKRQSTATLSPEQLVDYLSYELGVSKDKISYDPGEYPLYWALIIKERDFDKQQLGFILSSLEYTQVTDVDKPKPKIDGLGEITDILNTAAERARQLGTRIGLDNLLRKLGGGAQ